MRGNTHSGAAGLLLLCFLAVAAHAVTIEVCDQDVAGTPLATPAGCTPDLSDALFMAMPGDVVRINAAVHIYRGSQVDDDGQSFLVMDTDGVTLTGSNSGPGQTRNQLILENDVLTSMLSVPMVHGIRVGANNVTIENLVIQERQDFMTLTQTLGFSYLWFVPPSICNATTQFCNTTAQEMYDDTAGEDCETISAFYFQNSEVLMEGNDHFLLAQGCIQLCNFHVNLNFFQNTEVQDLVVTENGAHFNCTGLDDGCSAPIMKRSFDLQHPSCTPFDFRLNCYQTYPPQGVDEPLESLPYYNCRCNLFAPFYTIDDDDNLIGLASIEQALQLGFEDVWVGDELVRLSETTVVDGPIHLRGTVPDVNPFFLPQAPFQAFEYPIAQNATCDCQVSLLVETCVQPAFVVLNELLLVDEVTVFMEELSSFAVYRTHDELTGEEEHAYRRAHRPCNDMDTHMMTYHPDDAFALPAMVAQAYPDPIITGNWPDHILVQHSQFRQFGEMPMPAVLNALTFLDCTQPIRVRRNLFFDVWKAIVISAPAVNVTENSFWSAPTYLQTPGKHLMLVDGAFSATISHNWFHMAEDADPTDFSSNACDGGAGILIDGGRLSTISCNSFTDNDHGVAIPCENTDGLVCVDCDDYVDVIVTCLLEYFPDDTCADLLAGATTHPGPEDSPFVDNFLQCAADNSAEGVLTQDFIIWLQHYLVDLCIRHMQMLPADQLLLYLLDPQTNPLSSPETTVCMAIVQADFCETNGGACSQSLGNTISGNSFASPGTDVSGPLNTQGGICASVGALALTENTIEDNLHADSDYLPTLANQDDAQPVDVNWGFGDLTVGDAFWLITHVAFPAPAVEQCFSVPQLQATHWTAHHWHNVSFPEEKDCNTSCLVRFEIARSDWLANKPSQLWCVESGLQGLDDNLQWVNLPTTASCDSDPLVWEADACFGPDTDTPRLRYSRYVIGVGDPQMIVVNCSGTLTQQEVDDVSLPDQEVTIYDTLCEAVSAASPNSTIYIKGVCVTCHCHVTKANLTITSLDPADRAVITPWDTTVPNAECEPCLYGLRYLRGSHGGTISNVIFTQYNGNSFQRDYIDRTHLHLGTAVVFNPVPFPGIAVNGDYTAADSACWQFNTDFIDDEADGDAACGWWMNQMLYGQASFESEVLDGAASKFDGNYVIEDSLFYNLERGVFVGPAAGQVTLRNNEFGRVPDMRKRLPHLDGNVVEGVWLNPQHVQVSCDQFPDATGLMRRSNSFGFAQSNSPEALGLFHDFADTDDDGGATWSVCQNQFTDRVLRGVTVRSGNLYACAVVESSRHIRVNLNEFLGQRHYGVAVHRVSGVDFRRPLDILRNFFGGFDLHQASRAVSVVGANVKVGHNSFMEGAECEVYGNLIGVFNNYFLDSVLSFTESEELQNSLGLAGCGVKFSRLAFQDTFAVSNTLVDSAMHYDEINLEQLVVQNNDRVASHGRPLTYHRLEVAYNLFASQGSSVSIAGGDLPSDPWQDPLLFPGGTCQPGSCRSIAELAQSAETLCMSSVSPYDSVAASCSELETMLAAALTTVCVDMDAAVCGTSDWEGGAQEICIYSDDLAFLTSYLAAQNSRAPTTESFAAILWELFHDPRLNRGAVGVDVTPPLFKKRGQGYTGPVSALRGFTDVCGDLLNINSVNNVNEIGATVWGPLDTGYFRGDNGQAQICPVGQYLRVVAAEGICQCEDCDGGNFPISLTRSCGTGVPEQDLVECPSVAVQRGPNGFCNEMVSQCDFALDSCSNVRVTSSAPGGTSSFTSSSSSGSGLDGLDISLITLGAVGIFTIATLCLALVCCRLQRGAQNPVITQQTFSNDPSAARRRYYAGQMYH